MSNIRTLTGAGLIAASFAMPVFAQEQTAQDQATQDQATTDTASDAATDTAATPDAATVVATVNGTPITLGHMIVMRERLPEQYQQMPDQALWDGILEQLIQQTALSSDAALSGRAELMLENERRALLAGERIQAVADEAVTDEALQAAYDETYAGSEAQTEWNASHILVETEEEAEALINEIENGKDFAELAAEKSTGPSGPNGGELGWFGPGMMVDEFEEAVKTLEPGAVSAPTQTQFGWHVVKLNETREQPAPTLDDVRDDLAAQIQQEAVQEAIADITDKADVEKTAADGIDAALLRDDSILN
ncbi:peptidylprolyl isomerase [Profundibacterium mesophilum]|uniref:Parvulin-like PPIase n=1 Tax=Profundibacterium mesophilum KAUST100406-0324 TaxID=1037889 RepID=A0A921NRM0_9RHOB|nr:peptidylprolyl isomerase [Profundibacterium mesophilum]KAF0676367.1 PpiC-type peptidyl-prolyl cis-trans isomerase [Profundibacterium mesophilum KAUST100406-0324]